MDADVEGDVPAQPPRIKSTRKGRTKQMKRTEIEAGSKGTGAQGIDNITGLAYANVAASTSKSAAAPASIARTAASHATPLRPLLLPCTYPDLSPFDIQITETPENVSAKRAAQIAVGEIECEYVFGRAYDLRRHLRAVHGVVVEKEVVDRWALEVRTGRWTKGSDYGKAKA